MPPSPSQRLSCRQRGLGCAQGVVVGMFLGLAVWLAVILLATIVMVAT